METTCQARQVVVQWFKEHELALHDQERVFLPAPAKG